MRYIIFVIDGASNTAVDDEIANIDAFNSQLQTDGNWIMAAGIAGPERAFLIDSRVGVDLVLTGSINTSAEHYSGFWLIQADTPKIALAIAEAGSRACNRKVELRPFLQ